MLQIAKYETEPITGFTDVIVLYNTGNGAKTASHSFAKPENARNYVNSFKHDYILLMFENFVRAIKLAREDEKYYKTIDKDHAYTRLSNCFLVSQKATIEQISRNVLNLKDEFFTCLPGAKHSKLDLLETIVSQIIAFAKKELKIIVEPLQKTA